MPTLSPRFFKPGVFHCATFNKDNSGLNANVHVMRIRHRR